MQGSVRNDLNRMISIANQLLDEINKTSREIERICTTRNDRCNRELSIHLENSHLKDNFETEFQRICQEIDITNPIQMAIFENLDRIHRMIGNAWKEAVSAVNRVKERLGIE